jgi:hypothetical protein
MMIVFGKGGKAGDCRFQVKDFRFAEISWGESGLDKVFQSAI